MRAAKIRITGGCSVIADTVLAASFRAGAQPQIRRAARVYDARGVAYRRTGTGHGQPQVVFEEDHPVLTAAVVADLVAAQLLYEVEGVDEGRASRRDVGKTIDDLDAKLSEWRAHARGMLKERPAAAPGRVSRGSSEVKA